MGLLTLYPVSHTLCSKMVFSASFSRKSLEWDLHGPTASSLTCKWATQIHLFWGRCLSQGCYPQHDEVEISSLTYVCELQTGGNLLSPSCQHVRGAELLAQGVSSLTHPFSSLSALFWKWSNTLALYNLSTLYHFSTSHPRLWAQKQGISVSPSPPLFQDLPHPFPLIQPIARIAVWSELCAPCQKFLPKMKKKTQ